MQYLYNDGELYYFMDMKPTNKFHNRSQVEDAMQYVKENSNAIIKFFKGSAFSVEPPNFAELEVTRLSRVSKVIQLMEAPPATLKQVL